MTRIAALVATVAAALAWPGPAFPSCIPRTPDQQMQSADVVFDGVALQGPTATGVQRFRADRYLKGSGPNVVPVATGVIARPDGTGSTTSVSVDAAAGERWRVYASRSPDGSGLETSVCSGSRKLAGQSGPATATATTPPAFDSAPQHAAASEDGVDRRALLIGALLTGFTLLTAALILTRRRTRA